MRTETPRHFTGNRQTGSALLSAVIFSTIVMLVLGSYLYLSSTEYRVSTRSYLFGASFNLAEGGIDLALDALRDDDSSGWKVGTDGKGDTYWARAFTGYDLGGNITGEIRVVILDATGSSPEIYTEGRAVGHLIGDVTKQLYVQLESGFLPFQNGFNSKEGVVLKGNNVTFDSYDSRVGSYSIHGNRNSNVTVSTISVVSDAIDIGNANVYGYVATGGGDPDVGPQGEITTYENPGIVDPSRITKDYYAEFPNVEAPSLISPSTSLPRSGIVTGGDYLVSNWKMSGKDSLYITGDTRIVVTDGVSISGKALVHIADSATVEVYGAGDIDIGGNGVLNVSQNPRQLMIFGTNQTEGGQTIKIAGNGYLASAVYAPNATVELKGGGSDGRVFGAVVGYDAKLVGNSHFSYDEALEAYNIGGGNYAVDEWAELTGYGVASMQVDMSDYGI